jgi:flagellar motor switch protein FliN/FliY
VKAFWEIWNREFAPSVAERMGGKEGEFSWSAADELPPAQDALAVALRWDASGAWRGSVTLLASRGEIATLLAASGEPSPAAAGGEDLPARWVEWLQDVLAAMPLPEPPAEVAVISRPQGVPLTPYLLRARGLTLRMAIVCELSEKAGDAPRPASRPETRPETASSPAAGGGQSAAQPANLDLLLDIEVDASLRFGSRELAIRELLETGPGDVLELDRHITDPVDLVVGDKIVARGEVVLVNGNFGLRVTEVAEPKKCLESVRCLF